MISKKKKKKKRTVNFCYFFSCLSSLTSYYVQYFRYMLLNGNWSSSFKVPRSPASGNYFWLRKYSQ